ncbi:MAG: imelysin family protein [Archangium sp.]
MRRLFASLLLLSACSSSKPTPPEESTVRAAVLAEAGRCIELELTDFATKTQALVAAFDEADQSVAQTAFRDAMEAAEVLEALQIGPAAPTLAPGGDGLRDAIYAWSLVSRCALEETIVAKGWEQGTERLLVNRKTLAALDYLLFSTTTDTACPSTSSIVTSGSWAALSTQDLATRRRDYARAVAIEVHANAVTLADRWTSGFTNTLSTAGAGNRTFMSQRTALNAVSDALFYLDGPVKDSKLAAPLGLTMSSCATPPCLDALEFQHVELNTVALRANIKGFSQLMHGCGDGVTGKGFDSLLIAANANALEEQMRTELAALRTHVADASELRTLLQNDPAAARVIYDEVKDVTDLLKTQFIGVLDLEIPTSLEGDND